MAQVSFKRGTLAKLGAISRTSDNLYFATDVGVLFLGDQRISDIILANSEPELTDVLANQIHIYNNKLYFRGTKKVDGSDVQAVVSVDAGALAQEIADLKTLIGTIPGTATATTVVGYAKEVADAAEQAAKDVANEKVASISAEDASINVDDTTATAPVIRVNIHTAESGEAANMLQLKAGKGLYVPTPAAADTYKLESTTAATGFLATYVLNRYANGDETGTPSAVGTIDIPKDFLLKSGTVEEVTEANKGTEGRPANAGTYIKMVLNTADSENGTGEDKVLWINVGSLIEYVTGGTAADGMITVSVDGNTHVATATINDGTITLAKLHTDVQTEINKAHEHSNKALLDTYTQTEANLADAVTKKHSHENSEELDKFEDGDKAALDAAAAAAATAVQEIQVNGTAQTADSDNKVNLTAVTGDADGQIKIAGQNVGVKGLQSSAYKTTEFFIGTSDDTKDSDTITGAKKYADSVVGTALTWEEV